MKKQIHPFIGVALIVASIFLVIWVVQVANLSHLRTDKIESMAEKMRNANELTLTQESAKKIVETQKMQNQKAKKIFGFSLAFIMAGIGWQLIRKKK